MLMLSLDVVWLGWLWASPVLSVSGSSNILLRVRCSLFLMVMSVSLSGVIGCACLDLCSSAEVVPFDQVLHQHLPWVGGWVFPVSIRVCQLPLPLSLWWHLLLWLCPGFLQSSQLWLFHPLALWVVTVTSDMSGLVRLGSWSVARGQWVWWEVLAFLLWFPSLRFRLWFLFGQPGGSLLHQPSEVGLVPAVVRVLYEGFQCCASCVSRTGCSVLTWGSGCILHPVE